MVFCFKKILAINKYLSVAWKLLVYNLEIFRRQVLYKLNKLLYLIFIN